MVVGRRRSCWVLLMTICMVVDIAYLALHGYGVWNSGQIIYLFYVNFDME
jgi:hypothetical protein